MCVKGEEAREFQYLLALGIIIVHVEPVVGDAGGSAQRGLPSAELEPAGK